MRGGTKDHPIKVTQVIFCISLISQKTVNMNEYKTIDSLFKKFANPIKEDYEALAVSLMKNFSITKCEKDSEGIRNVKYRIADLEFYLYSTDDTEDVATLNRDCIEGQWFFHRFGVDIAFRTLRGDNNELIRFGGVLIRGLEKYENGKHVGNISGSQRCLFDMFNASDDMPKLIEDKPLDHIEIFNTYRVESRPLPYRYFKDGVDWQMKRKYVFQTQKSTNGTPEYHIWHDYKDLTKNMYKNMPKKSDVIKKIYPSYDY